MLKPDNDTNRAFIALENNTFFQEVLLWIEESLKEQSISNNKSSGEVTIKTQGRNLELEEILKYVRNARQYEQNAKESKRMEVR